MTKLINLSATLFSTDLKTGNSGSIKFNLWLAQLWGIPILGLKEESMALKFFLLIYGIPITIFITFLYTFLEIYDLYLCWSDLDNMTQNSCLSLTHLAGAYKIANTFYRLNDISKIMDKLRFITRKFVITKKQQESYLFNERQNKMFLTGYAMLVGYTGLAGIGLLYYNPERVAGKSFPYRVYIPEWLPKDIRNIYMGLAVLIAAIQIVSIDYLNVNLMNQIRSHLNILNLAFEELITPDNDGNEFDIKFLGNFVKPHERLKIIMEHHAYLKSLRNDIEDVFRTPVLIQFVTSLSIFALTGFQATVRQGDTNGDSLLIYFYCCCIFCELFFYCWFGNELFEQNKTLADSGFNSTWYKFDKHYKKSLLIFMINAQRPIQFTAGGFMNLSLPSFSGILTKAYTYIAVLRQIYGK